MLSTGLRRLVIAFLVLVIVAAAYYSLTSDEDAAYGNVSVHEARSLIQGHRDLVVLDVRTASEYGEGHIEGALNIPVQELEGRLSELDAGSEYLVYCRSGSRSGSAAQIMRANGFEKVYQMSEGITAWISAGYPVAH
jgi:rhodanese-related sulfurtransferase